MNFTKYLIGILFSVYSSLSFSQVINFKGQVLNTSNICSSFSFNDNIEAKNSLDKICLAAGLVNNYVLVPCPNIGTCLAIIKDGIPMILYDNSFLTKIKSYGFTEKKITNNSNKIDWNSLTILAHELGHHVNQHFSKLRSNSDYNKLNELEADEFAGITLHKLGATLEQVKNAYFSLPEEATFNHPSRKERLKSIEKGYESVSTNYSSNTNNYNSLIIGNWKTEGGVTTFLNNGTLQAFELKKFSSGFWNITNGKLNLKIEYDEPGLSIPILELTNYTLTLKPGEKISHLLRSDKTAIESYEKYFDDNWNNFVQVGKSTYTYRNAGGIWDVKIPIKNNSDRNIKYLKLKVDYIKDKTFASGRIYKTEYVEVENIKAHSTIITKAPNSDRGVNVAAIISDIKFDKN